MVEKLFFVIFIASHATTTLRHHSYPLLWKRKFSISSNLLATIYVTWRFFFAKIALLFWDFSGTVWMDWILFCSIQLLCTYFSYLLPGVAIMLSITIFATIVGDMLPVSDATPLIGQHIKFCTIWLCVILLLIIIHLIIYV